MNASGTPIAIFVYVGKTGRVGVPLLTQLEFLGYQMELYGETSTSLTPPDAPDRSGFAYVLLINPDPSAGRRLFESAMAAKKDVIVVFDRTKFDLSYRAASLLAAGPQEVHAFLYQHSDQLGLGFPPQTIRMGLPDPYKNFWNWLQVVAPFSQALSAHPQAWTAREQLAFLRENKSCVLTRAVGVGLLPLLPMEGADLSGIDWKFGQFVEPQFAGASFSAARIEQIWCLRGDFARANFENAVITSAQFRGSDFEHARFNHAKILGAHFNQCSGRKSIWNHAALTSCDLHLSRFDESSWKHVSFRSCPMQKASFVSADLTGAAFEDAIMDHANLSGARLAGARFKKICAAGLRLDRVFLANSHWEFCELPGLEGASANLSDSSWAHCNLDGANLEGAHLAGANLSGALLMNANFAGANLQNAKLNGAVLHNTNLRGANLTGAELNDVPLRFTRLDNHQRELLAHRSQSLTI